MSQIATFSEKNRKQLTSYSSKTAPILRTRKTENSRQQISLALGSDVYESAE